MPILLGKLAHVTYIYIYIYLSMKYVEWFHVYFEVAKC